MIELINYKNINKTILLSIITFLMWVSIGSKYSPFPEVNDLSIKVLINKIRFYLPLLLISILFFYKKNYQNNIYLKIIIFFIFLSFIIGNYNLYQNNPDLIKTFKSDQILIQKGYLPNLIRDIMMSIYFLCTYLIISRFNQNETRTFLKLNYFFLLFISFLTLFFSYKEYFSSQQEYLYFTQFLITGELFGVSTIRSLGLSRNLFIIFIPLALLYLFKEEKKNNLFLIITLIFLGLNIFQLQSRLSIYSYYIFCSIIIIFFFYKGSYKKIIKLIIIFLIIPQFLNILIPIVKNEIIIKKDASKKINMLTERNKLNFEELKKYYQTLKVPKSRIYTLTPNNDNINKNDQFAIASEYSSGRLMLWKKTLNLFTDKNNLHNNFLGFGSSADRFFLKESVSNAILYSLISGGAIGLIFIILFYLYILWIFFIFLKNKEKYSKDFTVYSSIIVIIFLMLRSLVESSFLIFGSDNIILFICLSYLNKKRLI